jgi:cytochrome bd ubiquinol oxidase subunit I
MPDLFYARAQMGMSLAFHIVFAAAGVALPLLMVLSDLNLRRTGDRDELRCPGSSPRERRSSSRWAR